MPALNVDRLEVFVSAAISLVFQTQIEG